MSENATPFEALQSAVLLAGSQSAFARICGVSQTAVWKWLQSGKRLPAEHVLAVESTTKVSRHLLRPDIYPLSLAADRFGTDIPSAHLDVACDRQLKAQRKDIA